MMAFRLASRHLLGADLPLAERWFESRPRSWLIATGCFTVVLALFVALAYASPPDPTWHAGIYDDSDYDDLVKPWSDGTGASNAHSTPPIHHAPAGFTPLFVMDRTPSLIVSGTTIRGPPLETGQASVRRLLTPPANLLPSVSRVVPPSPRTFAVNSFFGFVLDVRAERRGGSSDGASGAVANGCSGS